MAYKLGQKIKYTDRTVTLGTGIQLSLQKKDGGDKLSAYIRCREKFNGERTSKAYTETIQLTTMQHMLVKQVVTQKITETGYDLADFCLVGELEFDGGWKLSDEGMDLQQAFFLRQKSNTASFGGITTTISITELVVLNRAILHTDGHMWYSESVELGEYREGVRQLESKFQPDEKGKLTSGEIFGTWVWTPRSQQSRAAQDMLTELSRIYPQAQVKRSLL